MNQLNVLDGDEQAVVDSLHRQEKLRDQKMKYDIAEYRILRGILVRLYVVSREHDILSREIFDRIESLNNSTWPDRNEQYKVYNDSYFDI